MHLTDCLGDLVEYRALEKPFKATAVGGGSVEVVGVGKLPLTWKDAKGHVTDIVFSDVYYAPGCQFRLLSVDVLRKKGFVFVLNDQCALMMQGEETAAKAVEASDGRLYLLGHVNLARKREAILAVLKPSLAVWHRRFGHLSYGALAMMARLGMVEGLDVSAKEMEEAAAATRKSPCGVCVEAKMTRSHFPARGKKAAGVLERVHMDVCGPMRITSAQGARFVATFYDEHSGYGLVRCVPTKDSVPVVLKDTLLLMEKQTGKALREVQSDRGGEYINAAVGAFLADKGVVHNTSAPYTPEQNGRAERLNRTLLERARAMLRDSGVSPKQWDEAIKTACVLHNLSPVKGRDKVPFETFYGVKPDASVLRAFGSRVWVHVPKHERHKLECPGEEGVFVGYEPNSASYRVLMADGRIEKSANVVFDESPRTAAAKAGEYDYNLVALAPAAADPSGAAAAGEERSEAAGGSAAAAGSSPAAAQQGPQEPRRYLKGTVEHGIVYGGGGTALQGYSDADWGGDRVKRKSTTGYVFTLNGGAVSWSSKLQPTVAASTMEAEYMAAAAATREALWLRNVVSVFTGSVEQVLIWGDNQGALSLIKNPLLTERSKHIDVQHHFVRDRAERGEVKFEYCPTAQMVADMLTKALPEGKFVPFRWEMGIRE